MTESELRWLGFSDNEIKIASDILWYNGGRRGVAVQTVVGNFGVDYDTAYRVKYIVDLQIGKKSINIGSIKTLTDIKLLSKHVKSIGRGNRGEITVASLAQSNIIEVPRMAVVAGIKDATYSVFNSKDSNNIADYYVVDKITQDNMILRTKKSIILKYNKDRNYGVDGVIRVMGKDTHCNTLIEVNRKYCRLCNRYVIAVSMRAPSRHVGAYAVMAPNGDIIYIYAKVVDGNRTLCKDNMERIYSSGILKSQINKKLMGVTAMMIRRFSCTAAVEIKPTENYKIVGSNKLVGQLDGASTLVV